MSREFWLMDERAMDPEQFGEAIIYCSGLRSILEASEAQAELGCGVIIEVAIAGDGVAEWVRYVEAAR